MKKLIDVPNVDGVTTDYPKGSVRDKAGLVAGTTGGAVLFADIIQFFQKLVIDAGITENNLPDNVSNGYQLLDALVDKIKNKTKLQNTRVSIYNAAFSSGTITIASVAYDRAIYMYNDTLSISLDIKINIDGNFVLRHGNYEGLSYILPGGSVCTIDLVGGSTSHLEVNSFRFGI